MALTQVVPFHADKSLPLRCALALAWFGAALLVRVVMLPVDAGMAYLTFYPAALLAYYLCGVGPGHLVVALSTVTGLWVFSPPFMELAWSQGHLVAALVFAASCAAMGHVILRHVRAAVALGDLASDLRVREQRMESMLESQTEFICRFKADGTIIYVNESFCRKFGTTRAHLVGHVWHPVAWPADVPDIESRLKQMTAAHPIVEIVNRILTPEGVRWGQFINRGVYDELGRLQEIQSVGRDITELEQLKESLKASRDEYLDLYNQAPCGYQSVGADGKILFINDTALSWLGHEREDVVGKMGPPDFFNDEGRAVFLAHFERFKRDGQFSGVEFDLVHRNGTVRRVSVSATAIRDEQGRFVMSRTVLFDISELHAAKQRMSELLREQEAMLNNEVVGMVRLRNRIAVWTNRALARIFGYEHEELTGKPSRIMYLDEATYERVGVVAYDQLRRTGMYRGQVVMRHKDGTPVWVDLSAVMLDAAQNESLWVISDITALKKLEAQQHHGVRIQAESQRLQETTRLHNYFLSCMSHELRTPLNGVIGFAQVMASQLGRSDAATQRAQLNMIEASGQRLLHFIDRILTLVDMEAGRMDFRPVPTDVGQVVRAVMADAADSLEARRMSQCIEVADDLVDVDVDPMYLAVVLTAYVSNAIKFSEAGGRVVVRGAVVDEGHFRIEVEDRGIGIAPSELRQLFLPFHQVHTGLQRSHEGAGLGLYLVRRLVEAQGGSVGVRSTPGQGSVFHLVLPRHAHHGAALPA